MEVESSAEKTRLENLVLAESEKFSVHLSDQSSR